MPTLEMLFDLQNERNKLLVERNELRATLAARPSRDVRSLLTEIYNLRERVQELEATTGEITIADHPPIKPGMYWWRTDEHCPWGIMDVAIKPLTGRLYIRLVGTDPHRLGGQWSTPILFPKEPPA